ncbi:MAG: PAS domain S-box protein [Planctomycetota bacterium]
MSKRTNDLKESKEQIQLLLNSTGEAIYGLDNEGNCTFVNAACLRMLGYREASHLIGAKMHDLIHYKRVDGTPYPIDECKIYKSFREGGEIHVDDEVLWRADGTCFPVEYMSHPIRKDNKIVGSVVTFTNITERKKMEEEVRSLAKFPSENPNPVLRISKDGKVLFSNKAGMFFLNTWGCKQNETVPENIRKVISDVLSTGSSRQREETFRDFVFSLTVMPVKHEGYVNLYGLDVTEKRFAEQELNQKREQIQLLLDSTGEAIYGVNTDGCCTFVNRSFLKLLGYSNPDQLIGKRMHDVIHYKHVDGTLYPVEECKIYLAFLEGKGTHIDDEVFWKVDGSSFPVEYMSYPIFANNKIIGSVVTFSDITERKKTEKELKILNERLEQRVLERTKELIEEHKKLQRENTIRKKIEGALRESEKKFQDLYENLPDMYLSVDAKTGKVIQCNKTLAKKLGYKVKEIVGKERFFLYHPDCIEEAKQVFQKFINTGEVNNAELQMKRRDGSKMEVLLNATAFRDKDGEILYSRSVYRDITERKRLQQLLMDQKRVLEKKNIALSEILGQLEIEKKQIKDNVVANAENLILPIIQKLRLTGEECKYVQLLQKNLEELVSSFGSRLIENAVKLTTREIEICNMVKNGLTNKEIARLLIISLGTTKRHRNNIRKKLGIINTDMNLASFLNSK